MDYNEKTIDSEYIYKGKILALRKDNVLLPDGKKAIREVIEHSGGSAVVCENEGKILLVRQFRAPYKKTVWEIPAGKINKGEDPINTAFRELEEEGGVKADKMEKLFEVYPSTGYTDEIIYIYRAVGLRKGNVNLDEDEFLSSKWFEKTELKKMVENGEICDAKTLIALLKVLKVEE